MGEISDLMTNTSRIDRASTPTKYNDFGATLSPVVIVEFMLILLDVAVTLLPQCCYLLKLTTVSSNAGLHWETEKQYNDQQGGL